MSASTGADGPGLSPTGLEISAAFATSLATPDLIVLAEELGYRRAWCYDSPALYPDVWMALTLAAQRTTRIGLGPAVLVPSLRHPMVNAAAIATLEAQAPGRVSVAIGSGFTGRMVLGQRPMKWKDVQTYVEVLRTLLRGEDAQWDGATLRMLHPDGFGAARPVDVPVLIGADGPKGLAVASAVGDGVFSAVLPQADAVVLPWRALLNFGTVLDEGEDTSSPRARQAYTPAVAVAVHGLYERRGAAAVQMFAGIDRWLEATEAIPEAERHLAIHEGHLIAANERDELLGDLSAFAEMFTFTGSVEALRTKLTELQAVGVTEVAYAPAGDDLERELRAFAAMAQI